MRPSLDHQLSVQNHCTAARPLIAQFGANESHFSHMSRAFSVGKLQGQERKEILQAVQAQAKSAACAAIKEVLEAFLEAEVSVKLGREKGESRRISGQERPIDWECGHCGCTDANQFTRDGHYQRGLSTSWGQVSDLRVPMLECQVCQHDVASHFALLEKYHRFWMDLDQNVLFASGFGESLRHLQEQWNATVRVCELLLDRFPLQKENESFPRMGSEVPS